MDQGSLVTFKSFSLLQFNRRFLVTVAMALTEESVVKIEVLIFCFGSGNAIPLLRYPATAVLKYIHRVWRKCRDIHRSEMDCAKLRSSL